MVNKLIIALFSVTGGFVLYDWLIRIYKNHNIEEYSVNLSILYFVVLNSFIIAVILIGRKYAYKAFDKKALLVLCFVFVPKIVLNLSCVNQNWDVYAARTSNIYIDLFTAIVLLIALIVLLCQKKQILVAYFQRFFF